MDKYDYQERYERWWKGKYCRPICSDEPFKRVVKVTLSGPPSFVYGGVILHYDDGTEHTVFQGEAFRPRKSDIEVKEQSHG